MWVLEYDSNGQYSDRPEFFRGYVNIANPFGNETYFITPSYGLDMFILAHFQQPTPESSPQPTPTPKPTSEPPPPPTPTPTPEPPPPPTPIPTPEPPPPPMPTPTPEPPPQTTPTPEWTPKPTLPPASYIPVTDLVMMNPYASITKGQYVVTGLIAVVYPINASNMDVIWASSDPNVASVSDNDSTNSNVGWAVAWVSSLNPGTAVITATTLCGNHVATSTITVLGMYQTRPPVWGPESTP